MHLLMTESDHPGVDLERVDVANKIHLLTDVKT